MNTCADCRHFLLPPGYKLKDELGPTGIGYQCISNVWTKAGNRACTYFKERWYAE